MRIAYVSAGAAGMLCGSCIHDNTLAAALRRLGHDVALIPTYTPMRTDETDVSSDRVFYGAVNLYLEERWSIFRRLPAFARRLLDSPALLDWAGRLGASTDAAELGDLTLSVLQGDRGHHERELDRLAAWLRDEFRPDIVHLTNSMFLGLARPLREAVGVPVICSVQGEDLFLEQLPDRHRREVHSLMKEKAADPDLFIATSRYYAAYMSELLEIPAERMLAVPLGLNMEGHGGVGPPRAAAATAQAAGRPFTIGYMARLCPEKGLHLLLEALRSLTSDLGPGRVRVVAAGWMGARDRRWFERLERKLADDGLSGAFEHLGEVDRAAKIAMLGSIDVLSVPATYREPKGLYVLEALANGVPVVEPAHGAFPELIEATGGGVLFQPGSSSELARALGGLMEDPAGRLRMGAAGRDVVRRRFTDEVMARETLEVYSAALARDRRTEQRERNAPS